MTIEPPLYAEIVEFWRAAGIRKWFARDEAFDAEIRERFEQVHMAASRGEFADWAEEAESCLALLLLLDQFPRNLYRGSAHAYATDAPARSVARRALAHGLDQQIEASLRPFFYLPLEHSEDPKDQAGAVLLCERLGDAEILKWARLHAEIIDRFGRFPHRNAMLGRGTTPAEAEFLARGGFAG